MAASNVVATTLASSAFALGAIPEVVEPGMIKVTPKAWETMYMELVALGLETPSDVRLLKHGETPNPWESVHGTGTAAGAAGASVAWVMPASDYDANGAIFVQTSQTLIFKNGTQAKIVITGVAGAYTLTATPLNTTDVIPALGVGEAIFVADNQYAENSAFPQGMTPQFVKYTHNMQIIMSSYDYSNTSRASATFFNFGNGRTDYVKFSEDDNQMRFTRMVDYAMYFGASTGNNAGANETRMTGLVPWLQGASNVLPVAGALSISDLRNMTNLFESNRGNASNGFRCTASHSRMIELEDLGLNLLPNGAMVYGSQNGEKMVNLGYKGIDTGGYTFAFRKSDALNDPPSTGISGYKYNRMILFIPDGLTADAIGGTRVPFLELKYLASNGVSRRFQVYDATSAMLQTDGAKVTFVKEAGLHPKNALAFGLIQ